MSEAGVSKLGCCGSCTQSARYRCPRCSFPSCSLAHSKEHKLNNNCDGIAPPSHSLPLKANEVTWGSLMRDQAFISNVSRVVEQEGKKLARDKLVPQSGGKGKSIRRNESRLDERSEKEESMARRAREEDVRIILMPKGMTRKSKNASRFNTKQQVVEWTTEVVFHRPPDLDELDVTVVNQPIASTSILQQVLSIAMDSRDRKGKARATDQQVLSWRDSQRAWLQGDAYAPSAPLSIASDGASSTDRQTPTAESQNYLSTSLDPAPFLVLLSVLTLGDDPPSDPEGSHVKHSKQYYLLDIGSSLRDNLKYISVLEYPTIEVWPRIAFTKLEAEGRAKIVDRPSFLHNPGRPDRDGNLNYHRGNAHQAVFQGERKQDSGWGKRGLDIDAKNSQPDKRARIDETPNVMLEVASAEHGPQETQKGSGLVNYCSD